MLKSNYGDQEMPAISNLSKAHKQINEQMNNHQGPLTLVVATGFFDEAVKQFNLAEPKVTDLKAMKFDRAVDAEPEKKQPVEVKVAPKELTLDDMALEIANLKACLSEVATLAGYANYLSKYGLKRTEPAKKK